MREHPKLLCLLCKLFHMGCPTQPCKAFLRKTVSTTFTDGRGWDSTFPPPPLEDCIQCKTCSCSNRPFFPHSSLSSWLRKVYTSNSSRMQDFSSGSGSLCYRLRCHHMGNPVSPRPLVAHAHTVAVNPVLEQTLISLGM